MKSPRFSVVIPSYRQRATLRQTIDSLASQTFRDFELIVVDSSADETTLLLRSVIAAHEWRHPPQLVELAAQAFAGRQRSLGLEHASAEIVLTTDTDCVLPADYLARLDELLQTEAVRLGTRFAIGGAIRNGTPRSVVGTAAYWVEFSDFSPVRPRREGIFVPTANLAFPRWMALSLGGFADLPVSDDLETLNRWFALDVKLVFEPSLEVTHLNRTRVFDSLVHQFRLGKDSATVRRRLKLPDAWLTRAWPLWPALPVWRFVKIGRRVVHDARSALLFVLASPWTLATLLVWTAGFAAGSRKRD